MSKLVQPQSSWPYGKLFYGSIAIVTLLMLVLTYLIAKDNPVAGVSFLRHLLFKLSILLPVIFIWIIAARGVRRFKNYAYLIRESPEGAGMNRLANGLLLLVVYIIVLNAVSSFLILFKDSAHIQTIIALTNHLPIIFALLASWQLLSGTNYLVNFTNSKYWDKARIFKLVAGFLILMIPFTINFYQKAPDLISITGLPKFALPAEALIFTYVLPHSLVWLFGIVSAVNLRRYTDHVSGKIYKSLFRDVSKGIILVYFCIFFAQLIMLSPIIATNFSLGLFFIYGVLILAIAGFQYIFRGARKLQLVEEAI